jgi:hypothetical protein
MNFPSIVIARETSYLLPGKDVLGKNLIGALHRRIVGGPG